MQPQNKTHKKATAGANPTAAKNTKPRTNGFEHTQRKRKPKLATYAFDLTGRITFKGDVRDRIPVRIGRYCSPELTPEGNTRVSLRQTRDDFPDRRTRASRMQLYSWIMERDAGDLGEVLSVYWFAAEPARRAKAPVLLGADDQRRATLSELSDLERPERPERPLGGAK